MAKFRKKPVVIEAVQVTSENLESVASWCGGAVKGVRLPRDQQVIDIQTLEGEMRADIGNWIIRGVKGEFYPCKADIFAATYERVDDAPKAEATIEDAARLKERCARIVEKDYHEDAFYEKDGPNYVAMTVRARIAKKIRAISSTPKAEAKDGGADHG